MFKPKISVIIPVYNTEDYLDETLMSLLNQTMLDDIEVLMIDDGSTDNSRHIIERYALDYDNFHAYHKENEGQGIARNYGLKLAKGEYIHFFDSDDYLPANAYEILYNHALKNKNDIVICNVSYFSFYNNWDNILFKNSYNRLSENMDSTSLFDYSDMLWDTITCNKLYNKEFLQSNNIKFLNKKIFFEDIPFSLESYILADSIGIIEDELYFWRFRNNETSTTQQDLDVKNFKDRLEVLGLCNDLFDKYLVADAVRNFENLKWLNHDLKFFLKRIDCYPEEYYDELLDEVFDIVKIIPKNLFEGLSSYQKVLYNLILNKNYDDAVRFAPLENEFYENPIIPSFLNEDYNEYFDFKKDVESEELRVEVVDVSNDETSLFLKFEGGIYFLPHDCEYDISSELIDGNDSYSLEIDESKNIITVPFTILEDKNNVKIRVSYIFDNFTKDNYLKIKQRKIVTFDDFDIDINFRKSFYMYLDYSPKVKNKIEIFDISFNFDEFILKAKSQQKINSMFIENKITFEKYQYSVEYVEGLIFEFAIPYKDILSSMIKKWELNCCESLNNVFLTKKFQFFTDIHQNKFTNARNRINISNQIHNPLNSLSSLNEENDNLKKDYSKLNDRYVKLKKDYSMLKITVDEYKSRKVVKFVDKFKL